MKTLILCAGKKLHPSSIQTSLSNALIPVNGKPVIGWILDDLLKKGITEVCIVLREDDGRLLEFLERAYSPRLQLLFAKVPASGGSILHSLEAGLGCTPVTGLVRVILGDTLIRDPFEGEQDFLYAGQVNESARWCLPVETGEGIISGFIDKQELEGASFRAVAGYYHLHDGQLLIRSVESALQKGQRELSEALRIYMKYRPIRVKNTTEWYDFGHLDTIADARRNLLRPRHFNALTVNPVLNTIRKVSQNTDKLRDELNWYKLLPPEIQVLAPRIVSESYDNGQLEFVQEYYGYPTLAEQYVYGDLDTETWQHILRNILHVHGEFTRHKGTLDSQVIEEFYVSKTASRLEQLLQQNPVWKTRLSYPAIEWNGQTLANLPELLPFIRQKAVALAKNAPVSIIHGDLCFSNILYDLNSQIIRLIDPRGSFGQKGIFGDSRYDLAKLRHSVAGLYDFMTADMFRVSEMDYRFESEIFSDANIEEIARRFDYMLMQAGYQVDEIRFIEGLLFISMLPLHADAPNRQLMMFLRGLDLLNEIFQTTNSFSYANSY